MMLCGTLFRSVSAVESSVKAVFWKVCLYTVKLDPGDLGLKAIRFWNPIWDPYLGPLWTHLDLLRPNCPI